MKNWQTVGNIYSSRKARSHINYGQADLRRLTGDVVAQYPRRDNSAVRTEEILQILLRHIFRQAADVQIRAFDRLAARSRVRHLEKQRRDRVPKKYSFALSESDKNDGINVRRRQAPEVLDILSDASRKKGRKNRAHAIIIALFLFARDKIRPNPGQPIYIAALPPYTLA